MKRARSAAILGLLFAGLLHPAVRAQEAAAPKGPERWEPEIAKFEARDRESPPPKDAVLFVGSSSIRRWKLDASFPSRATINRGFGGSTLADSVHFFDRLVPPYRPRAVVVYAGDNDIAGGLSAERVVADFERLAGLLRSRLPGAPVIYVAIKPSVKRWALWPKQKAANAAIAAWCAAHDGFTFADIATPMLADVEPGGPPKDSWFVEDGLHLSDEGYVGWTRVIEPLLDKILAGR